MWIQFFVGFGQGFGYFFLLMRNKERQRERKRRTNRKEKYLNKIFEQNEKHMCIKYVYKINLFVNYLFVKCFDYFNWKIKSK